MNSVILLYAKGEDGQPIGRALAIPFEQRPLDETLHPDSLGGAPVRCGNIYEIEVIDPAIKAALCQS